MAPPLSLTVPCLKPPDPGLVGWPMDRRSFLTAATAAAVAALASRGALAQSPQRAGVVEFVKGDAFAEASAARRALDRDAPVFVGDRCSTGPASRLALDLGANTRLKMGERAQVTIDRYVMDAGGEFTLDAGAMLYDRAPASKPAPVRIRSSFALIAVRGTRFFAGPSRGVFGVFVERGTVAVTAGGRRVLLRQGQGTDIRAPGAPPTEPKNWAPARVREALAEVS